MEEYNRKVKDENKKLAAEYEAIRPILQKADEIS